MPQTLAIVGPTASGKSALALQAARQWPVEIVSVDSALVYRGMDIGTAKPTAAERAAVPHHLIDIRDPREPYSAADFARDAARLIPEIHARGRHALLVGGTLLYLRALREGLDDMPAAQPALRAEIEAEARTRGWPALHAELAQVDPLTAARLAPLDSQRIARALEVYRTSGQPISAFQRRGAASTGSPTATPATNPWATLPVISLEPLDRAWLHQRIAQRLDTMFEQGLVAEVQALRGRGDLSPELPALRSVGYRQVWQALDAGDNGLAAREPALFASRQLAKRQLTGLRALHPRCVVACDSPHALDEGLRAVAEALTDGAAAVP